LPGINKLRSAAAAAELRRSASEAETEVGVVCDLVWLVGRTLSEIDRLGHCIWRFTFGPDAELRSECPWRVIRNSRVVLSNEDHGHQFGLPGPINAETECRALIRGAAVLSASIRDESRDFVLAFGPKLRLELVPLSSGYESWQLFGPRDLHIVAMGGGNLAVWGPDAEQNAAADRGNGD
jgi:hypothetical protein